jgi:S-DNA-T family DNA segregation ATPase FtsK/SpoIIIE
MKNEEITIELNLLDSFETSYYEKLDVFQQNKKQLEKDFLKKQSDISSEYQKIKEEYEIVLNNKKIDSNKEIQDNNQKYNNELNNNWPYLRTSIDKTITIYKSVSGNYFAIGAIGLFLSYLIFSGISIITLLISFWGFNSFYALIKEINSIKLIKSEQGCYGRELPFLYSIFSKPTISDVLKEEKNKYVKQIEDKYRNELNQKELELSNFIKEIEESQNNILNKKEIEKNKELEKLEITKQRENQIHLATINSFIAETRNQIEQIKIKLNTIHQLSSDENLFVKTPNSIVLSDRIYSISFYYTHDFYINLENDILKIPKYEKFGVEGNLFLNKDKYDKNKINQVVNELLLKQLLGIKPTKVKLFMYDPIELGAFFSIFHSLHKGITSGLIFTNTDDLNEMLDNCIRHISMVVQKLLQNKYQNLDDYNLNNSEMAEPYRILAINDFSNNFDDIQLKKINQILTSGSKCGVYVIIIGDNKSYDLIKENNKIKSIAIDNFNPVFSKLDVNDIITSINKEFENTGNIVVDINQILTKSEYWWSKDTSKSINIPIGKRGREIQELSFNNKDDNQALMIGKPGSGKSNLLHIILLSAITKYSPSELEIYLIDFKGGVEFSVYADIDIPHLKTVALESDREFGLSVIDGVEKELLNRENLFSNAGVQNLDQYNLKFAENKLPRILFIVDEFQEFFNVQDDLKDEVSQKYDRIIRKGRAFGINSLFSSQTLEGNSIPRSTKELIDIRIALMCGDNDVREIMDDKNLAAKDLSRPGEAIYNAENGKANGNQRFQAVFIERDKIVEILENVSKFSKDRNVDKKEKFIFRGDKKAYINKINHPINIENLNKFRSIRFWLGEPISIDSDVFSDFKFTPGNNLIIIGDEFEASRIISSVNYCLNRQNEKIQNKYLLNPLSDIDEGYENMLNAYGNKEQFIEIKNSNFDKVIQDLCSELNTRKNQHGHYPSIFVFLNSTQRLRNLRTENDTDGLSDYLNLLLEDGSEFGIFFILHFESITTLKRTSLRLKNFNHRIAFQLNNDSYYDLFSTYKIAPLKNNRAIYYNDELGKLTIIKPYELFKD